MRRRSFIAILLAGVVAGTVSLAGPAAAATCSGSFEGTVVHGPDAGLTLTGTLTTSSDGSGQLTGTLTTSDGRSVPVTGAILGSSIHLEFDLGADGTIRGNGTVNKDAAAACSGVSTGNLEGPVPGDTGNWGIIWGS